MGDSTVICMSRGGGGGGGDSLEENIIYNSLAWLNLTQSTLAMDRATNNSFKSNYFKILYLICWNI